MMSHSLLRSPMQNATRRTPLDLGVDPPPALVQYQACSNVGDDYDSTMPLLFTARQQGQLHVNTSPGYGAGHEMALRLYKHPFINLQVYDVPVWW